jgi:hypothetical protein
MLAHYHGRPGSELDFFFTTSDISPVPLDLVFHGDGVAAPAPVAGWLRAGTA